MQVKETLEEYTAQSAQRRARSRVGKLHHHAYMARDMAATRHFYEDILELPLVGTWVERVNPVTGKPDNYVHTFFELGDGSCLAFFQFKSPEASLEQSVNRFQNVNPFSHHIALTVGGMETVQYFKKKLADEGISAFETDHGYCYSIYFHDPNGMQVELTTLVPVTGKLMQEAERTAHAMLDAWLNEDDVATNNTTRGAGWVS
ncbi:VOC family protein [Paraburkholderia sp. ZP32-5]|uniref:VOC family protein n=1 Tax=Paraburkholderia sp. ZP32-5 TaxID=2883245 RepID=UPI001F269B08|nr:VOC family protein [Paraburkholderia sp. ZP32-5]